jgi:hypothetical protein
MFRPGFEEILQLSEALLLHVEHKMAVPLKLQGSPVEFYHSAKDRLYREKAGGSERTKECQSPVATTTTIDTHPPPPPPSNNRRTSLSTIQERKVDPADK